MKFLTLFLLITFLIRPSPVLANYVPPPDQKPPSDYSRSTGTRGGCLDKDNNEPLVILAPQNYEGQTLSRRPGFTWFAGDTYETDFRIFEFTPEGRVKQRGRTIELTPDKGIVTLSLPPEQEDFKVGQKYLWQVAIKCPNGNYWIQRAEVRVKEITPALADKLRESQKTTAKVDIYARSGFWYDAFANSVDGSRTLNPLAARLLQDLKKNDLPEDMNSLSEADRILLQGRIRSLERVIELYR